VSVEAPGGPAPLRVLIVDDEPPARAKLRRLLAAQPGISLLAEEAGDAEEALRLVQAQRPDAVFLDIQMPGRSGLELALDLPEGTLCVFCTAFDQHAVRAFDLHAVDYLLKPFTPERLAESVQRLLQRRRQWQLAKAPASAEAPRQAWLSALQQIQPVPGHWLVPQRGGAGLFKLPLADVEWVAAADNYIELHAPPAAHLDRCTLADFLAHASVQGRFLRVHRSHAINPAHVLGLTALPRGEAELLMRSGARLRVSRSHRAQLA